MKRRNRLSTHLSLRENTSVYQHVQHKNEMWQRRNRNLDKGTAQAKTIVAGAGAVTVTPTIIALLTNASLLMPVTLGIMFGMISGPIVLLFRGLLTEHATETWGQRMRICEQELAQPQWVPVAQAVTLANTPSINPTDRAESTRLLDNIWEAEKPYRTTHTPIPPALTSAKKEAYTAVDAIIANAHRRTRIEEAVKQQCLESDRLTRIAGTEILARYIREDAVRLTLASRMLAETPQP